jgi:hypothetical protein
MSSTPTKETSPNPFLPPPAGTPTKVYKGGCHCGKFEFECRHPVLEDGYDVVNCNCSICTQRGYLIMYVAVMLSVRRHTQMRPFLSDISSTLKTSHSPRAQKLSSRAISSTQNSTPICFVQCADLESSPSGKTQVKESRSSPSMHAPYLIWTSRN